MKNGDFTGPLDEVPPDPRATRSQRREVLAEVTRGIDLDREDLTALDWLATDVDGDTARVIASLIERARRAGLAGDLLADAERNLETYRSRPADDPECVTSGRRALHGIELAVSDLVSLRTELVRELGGVHGRLDGPDVAPDREREARDRAALARQLAARRSESAATVVPLPDNWAGSSGPGYWPERGTTSP
jgi:hypothetical protein